MLTRRGFIQTMAAVAAGAMANFDPLRGLWVPGAVEAAVTKDGVPVTIIDQVNMSWTDNVMGEQAELTDLALRFAKEMAERLQKSAPVVLRQIMLEHSGHANLGLITLTDEAGSYQGRGHFEPWPTRVMKEMGPYVGSAGILHAASDMARTVQGCDMFVPIGSDLRKGVPFADCLVGVATDPESGLSARALRFTTIDQKVHTGLEVAVGDWFGSGAHARRARHRSPKAMRVVLAPELLVEGGDEMASETDAAFLKG